jgi:beta-glucosidase
MKKILLFLLIAPAMFGQGHYLFPYLDPGLKIEERANDLLYRMTLEEKISQMNYDAPAIERLSIPKYNWWNECLHGVARNGLATVFPQAIGLAATWDRHLMHEVAAAISDEARAKYNDAVSKGSREIYQGLTFWSPNINIFRDPRWGRGMETYGEDPYLTGQMAVQFITGLQGDDPKYLKTVSTAKHFAVHSGPEPDRHTFNAEVSEYDLRETYLPAFKTSVREANVQSIMCAYNSLRGKACCSNDPLLEKILREEWGFKGYVVSDCWAISDIYYSHKEAKDAAEASAIAVKAGTDLECGVSYHKLFEAVQKGLVSEQDINMSVKLLMIARLKLGMFDPPEMVPFSNLKMDVVDSKQNRELARQTARESIVLLKNAKNLLPLKKNIKTIAVIGPNADDEEILLGNYNGTPSSTVTPLRGIIDKVGKNSNVIYERGTSIADNMDSFDPIPAEFLFTSSDKKQNGIKRELFDNSEWRGKPISESIDDEVNFKWLNASNDGFLTGNKSIRWTGCIVPPATGEYKIGGYGFSGFSIYIDDSLFITFTNEHNPVRVTKPIRLEGNRAYKLRIDFFKSTRYAQMQLLWSVPDYYAETRAIDAASKSDIVLLFMGLSPRLEGEEMKVDVKGFSGGDRQTLDLPENQEDLIKKIYALGKPVVLVLCNGSALSVNWENDHIPAIVESWYGGEEAGSALADVLFGDYNPTGRLPVTFYKSVDQLPDFKDYNMRSGKYSYVSGNTLLSMKGNSKGRTYRYFEGEPLYPFGYGLSYTKFDYRNLRLTKEIIKIGESSILSVNVKNKGEMAGDEIVQLYIDSDLFETGGPIKTLKGFQRISLKPGQTKTVSFKITPEMLSEFRGEKGFTEEKGQPTLMVGSSSGNSDLKKIDILIE